MIWPSVQYNTGRTGHMFLAAYDPTTGSSIRARSTTGVAEAGSTGGYFLTGGLNVSKAYTVWDDDGTILGGEMLVDWATTTTSPSVVINGAFTVPTTGVTSTGLDYYIKRNDTREPLTFRATEPDANGVQQPVDLTGASIKFKMRAVPDAGVKIVDATAQIVAPASSGVMLYQWDPADTDVSGTYDGEFEVTWPDLRKKTFPTTADAGSEYIRIHIIPDLD